MPCRYSEPGVLEGLLARALASDEKKALAEHLDGDCPDCVAAIERIGVEKFGEILSERAEAVTPRGWHATREETEQAFSRVMHGAGLAERESWLSAFFGGRFPAVLGAAAAAAVVIIAAVYVMPQLNNAGTPPGQTMKGPAGLAPASVSLWFDVGAIEDGRNVVKGRGNEGGVYGQDDLLVIRYRLDVPAFLYVVRRGADGTSTVVYQSGAAIEPAGAGSLKTGGQEAAFPLKGLSGMQTFTAFTSGTRVSAADLAGGRIPDALPKAAFSITVVP